MEKVVRGSKLLEILDQWQRRAIDAREVHEQAESMMDGLGELPNYPQDDARSIPAEVLLHLDALNHQLITAKDIHAMEVFLRTPPGQESQAWAVWRNYWDNLDLEMRRRELQDNPYYCT